MSFIFSLLSAHENRCGSRRGGVWVALRVVFTALAIGAAGCGGSETDWAAASARARAAGTLGPESTPDPGGGGLPPALPPDSTPPVSQPTNPGPDNVPPDGVAPPPPPPTPTTTAAKIDQVLLAQVMVYPVEDPELVLVGSRETLVVARLTTTDPAEKMPAGVVRVTDSAGKVVQESPLDLPTQAIPSVTPESLDFDSIYSATILGKNVRPGMQIDIQLADGQLSRSVKPRVGARNNIKLVMVPVKVDDAVGKIQPEGVEQVRARAPFASVEVHEHPVHVSNARPGELGVVLSEINRLHTMEHGDTRTYYYGFVPTRLFPGAGGLAYTGASHAAVSVEDGWHVLHEVAHNVGLRHASCGGAMNTDPDYPYADAALGAKGRYIWGYSAASRTFVDPRDTRNHDRMSYCPGASFSDYHYRLMQRLLDATNPPESPEVAQEPASQAPRELLLIAGQIRGSQVDLSPLKRFEGQPGGTGGQTYVLRLDTTSGVVEYPFDAKGLDHDSDTRLFNLSVPASGSVRRLQIFQSKQLIYERVAGPTPSPAKQQTRQKASAAPAQLVEQNGEGRVTWDADMYPYLTVIHVGARRTVLIEDMRATQAGAATLPLTGVPAGGSFEFILSDGLNTTRITQAR